MRVLFAPNFRERVPHLRIVSCGLAPSFGTKIPPQNPPSWVCFCVRLLLASQIASNSPSVFLGLRTRSFIWHKNPSTKPALLGVFFCAPTTRLANRKQCILLLWWFVRTRSFIWHKNPSTKPTLLGVFLCAPTTRLANRKRYILFFCGAICGK